MKKIVASIEARMGSSRLPGKVLMDIAGKPSLARLVERLRQSRHIDDIVIATTINSADDAIVDWANDFGVSTYRGSEEDVLARVVGAQKSLHSDIVVEVCGDTPLIDPVVIDQSIAIFLANDCDVVSNTWKNSYPQGISAQVFPLSLLENVEQTITDPAVREHVSLYFYENPDRYRIVHMMSPPECNAPDQRLQLDYQEDLELIRKIYERLEPQYGPAFGIVEVMRLLQTEPALAQINANRSEKPVR
jgi:spore coat polysaccharide biosynthesis protein SpsF